MKIKHQTNIQVKVSRTGISESDKDDLIYRFAFGCDRPKTPEVAERAHSSSADMPKGRDDNRKGQRKFFIPFQSLFLE